MELNIATAKIHGLERESFYFEEKCCYAFRIMFYSTSTLLFGNLPHIVAGETKEEAEKFCNQLKENFKKVGIHERGDGVICFESDGSVIAIGKRGVDLWIDVNDNFTCKTFKELKLHFTSMKLY